jgi:hypothetical protein
MAAVAADPTAQQCQDTILAKEHELVQRIKLQTGGTSLRKFTSLLEKVILYIFIGLFAFSDLVREKQLETCSTMTKQISHKGLFPVYFVLMSLNAVDVCMAVSFPQMVPCFAAQNKMTPSISSKPMVVSTHGNVSNPSLVETSIGQSPI